MEKKLFSVVQATRNEEKNIGRNLKYVKRMFSLLPVGWLGEIIVFDEKSNDRTKSIAEKYGAKVYTVEHQDNFHITKQKAIEKAKGDWILQIDTDEVITSSLAKEIISVLQGEHDKFSLESISTKEKGRKDRLFNRHQQLIGKRNSSSDQKSGGFVAYFIPRRNIFLGKPLTHAGVYPDGVIRLFKKGKARLPAKSVHELMEVDGKVGWLYSNLDHWESPTISRYLKRANRYTDLKAQQFQENSTPVNLIYLFYFSFIMPCLLFVNLYIRHKGLLDGMRGFIWCVFSALHPTISYFKYYSTVKIKKEKG